MRTIIMDNTTFDFLKKLLEVDIVQSEGRVLDEESLIKAYELFHKRKGRKNGTE